MGHDPTNHTSATVVEDPLGDRGRLLGRDCLRLDRDCGGGVVMTPPTTRRQSKWARARDMFSDRPYGRLNHFWVGGRTACGGSCWLSVDVTLKDGPKCKKCERQVGGVMTPNLRSTIRTSRKRRLCGHCGRRWIEIGDLYQECVAFPSFEMTGHWARLARCAHCAGVEAGGGS